MRSVDWSVYIIIDRGCGGGDGRSLLDLARAAIAGGATALQLRDKLGSTREMVALGRKLMDITRDASIPLIVNDRVDVALTIDADGAHVGRDDLPAEAARKLLGPDRLLGVSASAVDEALHAVADGADHLGVGDVFGTPSKSDAGTPIGIEGLAEIVKAVSVPVIAIGGVSLKNADQAIRAGAAGVAVISAIAGAVDPANAAARLLEIVEGARSG